MAYVDVLLTFSCRLLSEEIDTFGGCKAEDAASASKGGGYSSDVEEVRDVTDELDGESFLGLGKVETSAESYVTKVRDWGAGLEQGVGEAANDDPDPDRDDLELSEGEDIGDVTASGGEPIGKAWIVRQLLVSLDGLLPVADDGNELTEARDIAVGELGGEGGDVFSCPGLNTASEFVVTSFVTFLLPPPPRITLLGGAVFLDFVGDPWVGVPFLEELLEVLGDW